jgi:hypothetical protein
VINADGWFNWMERADGPPDKIYTQRNEARGIACHSMEGWLAGSFSRMLSTARLADGSYTAYAAASWVVSLPRVGTPLQHYPIWAATWTSGNRLANTTLLGVEMEGVAGQPMTPSQLEHMLHLAHDLGRAKGWTPTRAPAIRTVWQHNEVWDWSFPSAGPTACPSNRYQPFFDALEVSDMPLTDADLAKIRSIVREVVLAEPLEVDEPLRKALVDRLRLNQLAADLDATKVANAVALLEREGFV